MRIAFTIVLNGFYHLYHNNFAKNMVDMFDLWVIAEGAVRPGGSTRWCKDIKSRWQQDGHSVDGTYEELSSLAMRYNNVYLVTNKDGLWDSKDHQVNAAIDTINHILKERGLEGEHFLWEVDVDEQWNKVSLVSAEWDLVQADGHTGLFLCNFYVGPDRIAKGEWGEGKKLPYRRLWRWKGQLFKTHEPPTLVGGNKNETLLTQRFDHFAYYDRLSVQFKGNFYGGHSGVYERWKTIKSSTAPEIPVNALITGPWGKTNTKLVRVQ